MSAAFRALDAVLLRNYSQFQHFLDALEARSIYFIEPKTNTMLIEVFHLETDEDKAAARTLVRKQFDLWPDLKKYYPLYLNFLKEGIVDIFCWILHFLYRLKHSQSNSIRKINYQPN